jgi:DNA-directed RNA polymerase subunit RPC12/RpoP
VKNVANKLLTLPKISPEFTAFCKGHEFTKNEWMPCPQCGSKEVTKPSGAGVGAVAGASMMGCLGVIFLIATIFAVVFLGPIGWGVGAAGILIVILSPFLGAGMGSIYKCNSCSFIWSFKNIEELMAISKTT